LTLLIVFNRKNKRIGKTMVRMQIEKILAYLIGSGIKRGVLEK